MTAKKRILDEAASCYGSYDFIQLTLLPKVGLVPSQSQCGKYDVKANDIVQLFGIPKVRVISDCPSKHESIRCQWQQLAK
tara:strand:+ start:215 stop:454 length:240 start_codon:yes stop_codon:yes gene_type:complete